MLVKYKWQDFYQIEKEYVNDSEELELSEKVKSILAKLSVDVGIPAYALAMEQQNGTNGNGSHGHGTKHRDDYSAASVGGGNGTGIIRRTKNDGATGMRRNGCGKWEKNTPQPQPEFIATKITGKYEGADKIVQEIRICLNKLTDKNYAKQRAEIFEKMHGLALTNVETTEESGLTNTTSEDGKKVAMNLFDIVKTNKFFSKIYAQLYLELMNEFVVFREILDVFLENFVSKLHTIKYVDPEVDYDGYCAYIKSQDERKAMASFTMYLTVDIIRSATADSATDFTNGICEWTTDVIVIKEKILKIAVEFIDKIEVLVDCEKCINEVEEIVEIIFLFFTVGSVADWGQQVCLGKIDLLSKMKVKEHPSLSSRALFKLSDIRELLHKMKL